MQLAKRICGGKRNKTVEKKSRTQIVKDKKAEILMMHDMRNNLIQIDF